jgi:hypothetical protein
MKRFIQGEHRDQGILLFESLDELCQQCQPGARSRRLR